MTQFRVYFRKLVGLSFWLLVGLTSTNAIAQSRPGTQPGDEGIASYIFTPRTITVVLVLILVAQIVYRHRVRNSAQVAPVAFSQHTVTQPSQTAKKRYDQDELSKLLKASATSKNHGRSLEEAIRMSQAAQATLIGSLVGHRAAKESAAQVGVVEPQTVDPKLQTDEFESRSDDVETVEETETLK